jgi:hypothetical protein
MVAVMVLIDSKEVLAKKFTHARKNTTKMPNNRVITQHCVLSLGNIKDKNNDNEWNWTLYPVIWQGGYYDHKLWGVMFLVSIILEMGCYLLDITPYSLIFHR